MPVRVRPDWVCEILSTHRRYDVIRKKRVYHRSGVPYYWIIDPAEEMLSVLRWSPDGYVEILVAERGERVRAEPFEVIPLQVGIFFGYSPRGSPARRDLYMLVELMERTHHQLGGNRIFAAVGLQLDESAEQRELLTEGVGDQVWVRRFHSTNANARRPTLKSGGILERASGAEPMSHGQNRQPGRRPVTTAAEPSGDLPPPGAARASTHRTQRRRDRGPEAAWSIAHTSSSWIRLNDAEHA